MKRLPIILLLAAVLTAVSACNSDDDKSENIWTRYKDWRNANNDYFTRMRDSVGPDGKLFYQTYFPSWNPGAEILIHYFNDRQETASNLQPLLTSTCAVRYIGHLYNGITFDSTYTVTTNGTKGIVHLVPQNTVQGMAIALMDMHVGDSCEIIIPYQLGYGSQTKGLVLPYSAMRFNMRLTDIPYYEIPE